MIRQNTGIHIANVTWKTWIRALIISPKRELPQQVSVTFYGKDWQVEYN
ncbi:1862_t:CDS:2 [Entrophospora sp. SA101]|nr:1862_t:CDS:2 [Entrophospora sp. SA101]